MRVALFCHSLLSDWNHGNAHFLRGVVRELQDRGHGVDVFEPRDGWSLTNLRRDLGEGATDTFAAAYPTLRSTFYDAESLDLDAALEGADLVLVHEWTDRPLVRRIARHRRDRGGYTLLFHDTHHRAVTAANTMPAEELAAFDGALVFGEALQRIYRERRWTQRVWVWHEAADVEVFRPLARDIAGDLVWIGNWGDDERSAELHEFLIEPIRALRMAALVHGVRYPEQARQALAAAGIRYGGYLPNAEVPRVFAGYRATVHVPRRAYAGALPGIPTIRVFEALACGMPLVSAPWRDSEGLFTPGQDFLVARDGGEMRRHLRDLINDPAAAAALADHGRRTILARHTCRHRADELLAICSELGIETNDASGVVACAAG
jgi:spore maturation protein CgeB